MKDKELLIFAAKAADIDHPGGDHSIANDGRLWDCKALRWWNPLTDDGDALRLAVKLRLDIEDWVDGDLVRVIGPTADVFESRSIDPYAATRRAIVIAAAEIGRGMP